MYMNNLINSSIGHNNSIGWKHLEISIVVQGSIAV